MKRFVALACAIGCVMSSVDAMAADTYPSKPIHMISPPPGGGSDFVARIVAQGIAAPLGQPVIIESRPSPLIGEAVARSAPDGYTLALIGGALWLTPLLQKAAYNVLTDFAPITLLASTPHVLVVHPSVPARSIKELIALAKAQSGQINFASGPTGSEAHLAAELFKSMAGITLVRVPYKGTAEALNAVIRGDVQLFFSNAVSAVPQVKSGRLRALAVSSTKPTALLPEVPTMASAGLAGYEEDTLTGVVAPAGTPAPIVNRLYQEITRVLNNADVKQQFANGGSEIVGSSPEEFAATIKSEIAKWSKVEKDAGIHAD